MRYDVISADCHIDLCWLPPDLFTANASAPLKDRMPFVTLLGLKPSALRKPFPLECAPEGRHRILLDVVEVLG